MAQSTNSTSGTIRGTVLDPSGAAVPKATVEIQNPVSRFSKTARTDAQGNFELDNVPFNPYHLSASASGFVPGTQDLDVRSPLPLDLKVTLQIGNVSTTVDVVAEAGDLVETDPATHTDLDRALFDKLPLESQSSSLSSLVTLASPGISADSNGMFHGFGDHASNSFSVDGQPITDQQSKVFSNQISLDAVQSIEVIQGAPPAEFGDKTSVVIVATTRSGMGVTEPHGDATASNREERGPVQQMGPGGRDVEGSNLRTLILRSHDLAIGTEAAVIDHQAGPRSGVLRIIGIGCLKPGSRVAEVRGDGVFG